MTLRSWRIAAAAAFLAAGGCGRLALAPASYRPVPAAEAETIVRIHERDVLAMGLRPLRSHTVEGVRELRLYPSSGPGIPHVMARVLDRGGRGASVEWVAYWQSSLWRTASDSVIRAFERRMRSDWHCGPITQRDEVSFCLLGRVTGAHAAAMVARIDSAGAWPLPRPTQPRRIQLDGRSVTVEGRAGATFQSRWFGDHDIRTDSVASFFFRLARNVGDPAAK